MLFKFFLSFFFTETVKIEAVQNDMWRVLHDIVQHWVDLFYRTFLIVVVTQFLLSLLFFVCLLVDEVGGYRLTIEWSSWHSWSLCHVAGCVGGIVIEHDLSFTIPSHCGQNMECPWRIYSYDQTCKLSIEMVSQVYPGNNDTTSPVVVVVRKQGSLDETLRSINGPCVIMHADRMTHLSLWQ